MFFDFNRGRGGPVDPQQGPVIRGGISQASPQWLAKQLERPDHGLRLIDVREPYEYEAGHIGGARSARATMVLAHMGFETVHNLESGMIGWSRLPR